MISLASIHRGGEPRRLSPPSPAAGVDDGACGGGSCGEPSTASPVPAPVSPVDSTDGTPRAEAIICPIGDSNDATNDDSSISRTVAETKAMLSQEERYICPDYYGIRGPNRANKSAADMVAIRGRVCKWVFQVVDHARLNDPSESAIVAISFLDRFLSSDHPRARRAKFDRREYQLIAMTCLYLAVKISEPLGVSAATLSKLSRGRQSEEDIIECERDVLAALRWKLNGPTPSMFVSRIIDLLPSSSRNKLFVDRLRARSIKQIEISSGDYAFVQLRRSSIAVAAVLNSLEGVPPQDLSQGEREEFLRRISGTFGGVHDPRLVGALRKRLVDLCTSRGQRK